MTILWPFGCIERRDYSVSHTVDKMQQTFSIGLPFNKRISKNPKEIYTFSQHLTQEQILELGVFYNQTLQGGTLPFVIEYIEDTKSVGAKEVILIGDSMPDLSPEGLGYRVKFSAMRVRDVQLPEQNNLIGCAYFPVPAGVTEGAVYNRQSYIKADGGIASAGEDFVRLKSVIADVLPYPEADGLPLPTLNVGSNTLLLDMSDQNATTNIQSKNYSTVYNPEITYILLLVEHGLASNNPQIVGVPNTGFSSSDLIPIIHYVSDTEQTQYVYFDGSTTLLSTTVYQSYDELNWVFHPNSQAALLAGTQARLACVLNSTPTDQEITDIIEWMRANEDFTGCGINPDRPIETQNQTQVTYDGQTYYNAEITYANN